MKIRKLSLPAFGAFTEREIDFPDGPAVVVGPNEAGKTTLFTALTTLLYGFRPANERDFPYVPRAGGRRAELAADVVLGDGAEARASRRLLSSPVGEWQQGDGRENVGNHPLPPAAHVDHDLYRALYALTIDDMRVVEGQAFTQVEQRLLGELGNPWQRPARTVAAELDAAAKQQWRPNRKGKSRHRELKSQRNDLNTEFKSAKAHQAELREQEAERTRLGERLNALDEQRLALRERIDRSEAVLHLKRELERLDRLQQSVGDVEAARALGGDPRRDWEQLSQREAELAARRREWAEAVAHERARRAALSAEDQALLDDPEVAGLAATAAKVDEAGEALARQRQAEEQARGELMEAAAGVLEEEWDEAYADALEALSPVDLRGRCEQAVAAREEHREAARRLADHEPPPARPRLPRGYLIGLIAAAVALAGGALAWPPLAIPALLAAAGAAATVVYNRAVRSLDLRAHEEWARQQEELERDLENARQRQSEAAGAVAELLPGLPLPQSVLTEPRPELADRLEALRAAWRRYNHARRERDAAEGDWRRRAAAVTVVLARHGSGSVDEAALQPTAAALEQRLQAARQRQATADEARENLADLARRRPGLRAKDAELSERHADLAARLARAVPDADNLEECLARAGEVADIYRRWQEGWQALREHYPDVDDPRGRVAEAGDDLLEGAALEEAREELERLENERAELREEVARLDQALSQGGQTQDVGLIRGRLAEVDADLAATEHEHDRLRLLESLVREADRRFRETHQPDVLKRASAYLADVTGSRYTQLLLEEDDATGSLQVRDAAGELRAVAQEGALSRGTRDQVFFALRLAIADHLDAGYERLPLLLDEVFVHWDAPRQEAGLEGLRTMAGDRQLVLFTCHASFGQRMADLLGTEPITLPAPAPMA